MAHSSSTHRSQPSIRAELLPPLCGVALAVAASYAITAYGSSMRPVDDPPQLYPLRIIPGTEFSDDDLDPEASLVFDPADRGERYLTSTLVEDVRDRC